MNIRRSELLRHGGMTLIELLVVISIMLVLMVLASSSLHSLGRSTEVTNSIQAVGDALNLARQMAVSRNEYAQVRLYSPLAATDPGAGQFTAVAVFRSDAPYYTNSAGYTQLIASGRMRQEGRLIRLPPSCAIISNAPFSPLIQTLLADSTRQMAGFTLPDGSKYNVLSFFFKPNGSLDVPASFGGAPTVNALSICPVQTFRSAGDKLPPNYGIVNIDRINGRFQIIRP